MLLKESKLCTRTEYKINVCARTVHNLLRSRLMILYFIFMNDFCLIQNMQLTIPLTKTIIVNKLLLSFCDPSYLESMEAKLRYCHPLQNIRLLTCRFLNCSGLENDLFQSWLSYLITFWFILIANFYSKLKHWKITVFTICIVTTTLFRKKYAWKWTCTAYSNL